MDDKKPDARTIAEEAVGQTRGSPTPDTAKDQAVAPTDAEAMRQLATSAGPRAGLAVKTAESVGERVGDAYADGTTAPSRNIARPVWSQASRAAQQPFVAVAAGFALGYAAALLVHRRD
jgi:hypothetical protein